MIVNELHNLGMLTIVEICCLSEGERVLRKRQPVSILRSRKVVHLTICARGLNYLDSMSYSLEQFQVNLRCNYISLET